ncbi:MAG: hypothetical protein FWD94_00615 [Treponema sp.]|nr:hypothetical protein [Treponema sp.]
MKFFSVIAVAALLVAVSCAGSPPQARFQDMVADMGPVKAGTVNVVLDKSLGLGLATVEAEVVFHPRLNAVSLEFRHELTTYRQFWDPAARRQFVLAVGMYGGDFTSRSLVNRYRQTRSVYGKVTGRMEWQTIRFTTTYVSDATIEIGYRFRKNSPFLATFSRFSLSENDRNSGGRASGDSSLSVYFTRAQAAELAGLFDQEFLLSLIDPSGIEVGPEPETWDEYAD